MLYLGNAFSLQMMELKETATVTISPVTEEEARRLIREGFMSVIGHADTARVVSSVLGLDVAFNRATVRLAPGDRLLVAQVVGGRLPEGATTLPENFEIRFFLVSV